MAAPVLEGATIYRMACRPDLAVRSGFVSLDLAPNSIVGKLYVDEAQNPVTWMKALASGLYPGSYSSTTLSGVWIVPHDEFGCFAIAFGHGRHMLVTQRRVAGFGLRTVLNMLSAEGAGRAVRAVRKRTFASASPHARHQSDDGIELSEFDIDVTRDLVKGIEAIPEDKSLGTKLIGSDSLAVRRKIDPRDVQALLERYSSIYLRDTYRDRFPWVDHIAAVSRTEDVIGELLIALDRALSTTARPQGTRCFLARPDMSEHPEVVSFALSGHQNVLNDVTTGVVSGIVGALSVNVLQGITLYGLDDDGRRVAGWPLFECVNFECTVSSGRYVLSDGEWFRVDPAFERQLVEELSGIGGWSTTLPAYEGSGEAAYNLATAASKGMYLLDRKLVGGASRTSIEFCDILTDRREMVHVKRYEGAQAMSHLCYQAMNAAELLKTDMLFRIQLNEVLAINAPAMLLRDPVKEIKPQEWTVVLAIITRYTGRPLHESLSFFSKLALRHAYHHITRRLSYPMRLARVTDLSPEDTGATTGRRKTAKSSVKPLPVPAKVVVRRPAG
jgi:uncharacterized protein (TIGR04141 family)